MKICFAAFFILAFSLNSACQTKLITLTSLDTSFVETTIENGGYCFLKKNPKEEGRYIVFLHGSNNVILEFSINSKSELCGELISYEFYTKKISSIIKYCNCDRPKVFQDNCAHGKNHSASLR